ncbi:TRAP transporter large permease [Falsiroseomonas sp. HW251]|uniref:TRAP transporter large permease n=1 Tax=Falsiroseomonas sp. HW251 TaxID=3390998 RepID=UPI003D3221F7
MSDVGLLLGVFSFLLLAGVSCANSMLLASLVSIWVTGFPVTMTADNMLGAINSFTLLAVPFFILAGVIMNRAGLTARLIDVSRAFVGHFHGGTAQVNVVASMFFSGISGSASADAAAIGSMLIPTMKREGYDPGFAAGVTASAATMGPIIPPSIVMVIYGSITNLSIGALFLAGILPGILIGVTLMLMVAYMSRRRGYPRAPRVGWTDRLRAIGAALPAVLAPVIILGGMFSGVATATEAGVIACVYGLFVGFFVYRDLRLADMPSLLADAVEMTAVPMYILATSSVFGFMLTAHGLGFMIGDFLSGITQDPLTFLLIIVALLTVVGIFLDGIAALLIVVPVFAPLVDVYHVDPLQFALIVIMTIMIGTVTPPVGMQLYIAAAIARIPIGRVVAWPFCWAMTGAVVILCFVPQLATFLPRLLLP